MTRPTLAPRHQDDPWQARHFCQWWHHMWRTYGNHYYRVNAYREARIEAQRLGRRYPRLHG